MLPVPATTESMKSASVRRLVPLVGAGAFVGLAMYSSAVLACGGGAPVAARGTSVDDLPYTEVFQIMVSWERDLDGPATVSVGANIHNASDGFGYVVPIPQVIDPADLAVGSADLLDGLAAFTGPRALNKTCENFRPAVELVCSLPDRQMGGGGDSEAGWSAEELAVETTRVGDYEVSLLSSEGSDGLLAWLEAHDFVLPPGSEGHIDQYLEQGFMFAAVRVPPGTEVADGAVLPPLNFHLSEGFRTLPLLLASEAAVGTQDVVLTTWAPEIGAVGISNLAEVELEDDCMPRDDDMGAAYGDAFAKAHTEAGQAVWSLEYYQDISINDAWDEISSVVSLSDAQMNAIDAQMGSLYNIDKLGRVHIRYNPGELTADPAFYAHAGPVFGALEYTHFKGELTEFLPVCGEGVVEEGSCPATVYDDQYCDGPASTDGGKAGCSSVGWSGSASWLAVPLAMLFGVRRQRRF